MCYLIAKRKGKTGCIALKTQHGEHLADFKHGLTDKIDKSVQLVTISRPSAYGEYDPYEFVHSEEEFEKRAMAM